MKLMASSELRFDHTAGSQTYSLGASTEIRFHAKMRAAPLVEAGGEVEEDYYLLWRMEQGVAEGSTEIPKG